MKNKYDILITPLDGEPYETSIVTDDIYWSMKQYARNRKPFTYEIVEEWE